LDDQQSPSITASEIESIIRYLWALIDSYPNPINQSELADITGVSRSAITRIKNILNKICDLKSLAYERKLVLKNDFQNRMVLFTYFMWFGKPEDFKLYISSKYFIEALIESNTYDKIVELYPDYKINEYYTKEDFQWFIHFFINKFIASEPTIENEIIIIAKFKENDIMQQIIWKNMPINMQFLYSVLYDYSLQFLNKEEDFIKLLELRDKTHFLFIRNSQMYSGLLKNFVDWFEEDNIKNNEHLKEASEALFLAILKKILKMFTEHIYNEASKKSITINHKYKNIGSLFKK